MGNHDIAVDDRGNVTDDHGVATDDHGIAADAHGIVMVFPSIMALSCYQ